MNENAMDDEMFEFLLASLQQEEALLQSENHPWKGELIDCGSVAKDDSSCCFWLCLFFHLLYISKESKLASTEINFKKFKEICHCSKTHQSATPIDIQDLATLLQLSINVVEVDRELTYSPMSDIYPSEGEIRLVLYGGHYQIWPTNLDESEIIDLRNKLHSPDWKTRLFDFDQSI